MITAFTGAITKVLINSTQVFPGTQKISLEAGKIMTIEVAYKVTPLGDIGLLDYWTSGITAVLGTQFGWDPTSHRSGGEKVGASQIGNLKAPSAKSTLVIKLYSIDAVNPSAPGS